MTRVTTVTPLSQSCWYLDGPGSTTRAEVKPKYRGLMRPCQVLSGVSWTAEGSPKSAYRRGPGLGRRTIVSLQESERVEGIEPS